MWWPLALTYIFKVIQPWLDGFFLYLAQMITIIRGYVAVACYVFFQNLEIRIFGKFLAHDLEKKNLLFSMDYLHI